MSLHNAGASAARIPFIDVAKGLGILLVFYGHLVERFINRGPEAALDQMRWIYCFHMPLFFFLSGLVYKERALSAEAFLKRQILTRLVPAWFFNLLSMNILTVVDYVSGSSPPSWGLLRLYQSRLERFGWETLCGRPFFNILMWFLICLFVVELIQFAARKPLRRNSWLLASMVIFGGLTFVTSFFREIIAEIWGSLPYDAGLLKIDFWHISSALSAIVFYQAGILLTRLNVRPSSPRSLLWGAVGVVGLIITVLTYNVNRPLYPVVYVVHAGYGNAGWFFLTACAGIAFMVGLSNALSSSRLLTRLGQVTLGLMCLDGIFHRVINIPLAVRLAPYIPQTSALALTLVCAAITLLSILVSLPVVWFLDRYAPILTGRVKGEPRKSKPEGPTPVTQPVNEAPVPDEQRVF